MNNFNNEAEIREGLDNALLINNLNVEEIRREREDNINNGDGQNNQNRENNIEENNSFSLNSKDILEFSRDFFPSLILICLIMFSISTTEKYCDKSYLLIFKCSMYFQIGFLFKSISFIMFLFILHEHKYLKYSIIAFDYVLYLAYYIFILYASNIFKLIPNDCIHLNPLQTVLLFGILTLGVFDICRHVFNFTILVIGFPVLVYYFFKDPKDFIQRFGIDPELIDNWPTVTANFNHVMECVICSEEVTEGQQIMVLNCNGKHYFHAPCIKEWLKVKLNCPVCRSTNVF